MEVYMNKYVESVIANVKAKHANEPEFVQTVEEVLSSLSPVVDAHPEYEKADLLNRMTEPERMFTFRVVWTDDQGNTHTNRGWRCHHSLHRWQHPQTTRWHTADPVRSDMRT